MITISETETIIKRIIPYIERLGYDIDKDITFEDPTLIGATNRQGFIDMLIHCSKKKPLFLIEAKRDGTRITDKHRKQALDYAESIKCLFCVVTNGKVFEMLNAQSGSIIKLNGQLNKLPQKSDINEVIKQLQKDVNCINLHLFTDKKIPYRAGLSLSKMNQLIQTCHNIIRRIEKNEETAFADFSKFLFLKLLEEKWDQNNETPPYTYTFYELAATRNEEADKVKDAIHSMLAKISSLKDYGQVITNSTNLKQDITYLKIVKTLAAVSFSDCDLDSKGAAFEYFVRATLKGKKLGQYFTPRPLVKLMLSLGNSEQIVTSLLYNKPFKVLDPACGTGGFLVVGLNYSLKLAEHELKGKQISKTVYDDLIDAIKKNVFYGVDANEGVASSAKMNMIIAGDGHSNIQCTDSLKVDKFIPKYDHAGKVIDDGLADLILSNPPFGTVESDSIGGHISTFDIKSSKGQSLFIQKMISSIRPFGNIVTVIDEGVLNTESYQNLREHILKNCIIKMVLSLPDETFKPNKINVKSSVLLLTKRETPDENLSDEYSVIFVKINSLGYDGSGEPLRNFNEYQLISEISNLQTSSLSSTMYSLGYHNQSFVVSSTKIIDDRTKRLDVKYWDPETLAETFFKSTKTIKDINLLSTARGKSPSASDYVSQKDGYALVAKAGSSITKNGTFIPDGDYIEKVTYIENQKKYSILEDGDILLASTGDGTLGKCCVYRNIVDESGVPIPVIADGHITIIRVNQTDIYPEYLCDYLRIGIGAKQIERLYTGSTGLIELTPSDVDSIRIPSFGTIEDQKMDSVKLRSEETKIINELERITERKSAVYGAFYCKSKEEQ